VGPIPDIVIASYDVAQTILRRRNCDGVRHLVSIGDPGSLIPAHFDDFPASKLRLEFDDVCGTLAVRAGFVRATPEQMGELVAFLRGVSGKVLFHCAAGIGRSAAAACILAAMRLGPGREREALEHVLAVKQTIHPNKHMLSLADDLLERNGALLGAAFTLWDDPPDVLA
jgi:predicted protein tyrosine phosphatase